MPDAEAHEHGRGRDLLQLYHRTVLDWLHSLELLANMDTISIYAEVDAETEELFYLADDLQLELWP